MESQAVKVPDTEQDADENRRRPEGLLAHDTLEGEDIVL